MYFRGLRLMVYILNFFFYNFVFGLDVNINNIIMIIEWCDFLNNKNKILVIFIFWL